MRSRLSGVAVAAVLVAVGLVSAANDRVGAAGTYEAPLATAIGELPVAAETPTGYDRDLFPHWIDADGDGQNTRAEELIDESNVPVT